MADESAHKEQQEAKKAANDEIGIVLTEDDLVGVYRRKPEENGWHTGVISFKPGTRLLQWTNLAGKSWNLSLDLQGKRLKTDRTNPYFDSAPECPLHFRKGKLFCFVLGFDVFISDAIEAIPQSIGGLKGYISVHVDPNIPQEFGYGVSFYTRIWQLLDSPLATFQIGLPSTWILPDNRDFCEPLCPPGTVARDNWEHTRGKDYFRSVFQTVEGGLGYWCSTQFGSPIPKYRINGTPNGYNHEVSSPGFGFGRVNPLRGHETGIAQLSNRLLIPPDGFTFEKDADGLLGNAWMAIPWLKSRSGPSRHDATSYMSIPVVSSLNTAPDAPPPGSRPTPTGDLCWTLFLNAANFAGGVAFFVPDLWSHDSQRYPTIVGRTLDARPGRVHGGAMEVNTVPYFQGETSVDGHVYTRVPRLRFPVDEKGQTVLLRDMVMYSKKALYSGIKVWLDGGILPSGEFSQGAEESIVTPLVLKPQVLKQGPNNMLLGSLEKHFEPIVVSDSERSHAFALKWNSQEGSTIGKNATFPEYFRDEDGKMVPISEDSVPLETKLTEQEFLPYECQSPYQDAPGFISKTSNPSPDASECEAHLLDGSTVVYKWVRFVDQPVLNRVRWLPGEKENLQRAVEDMHREWTDTKTYLPPPGDGKLVGLDPSLLLKPPKGLEVGFVPIAYRQVRSQTMGEDKTNNTELPKGWTKHVGSDGRTYFTRRNAAGLITTTYEDPRKVCAVPALWRL